MKSKILEFVNAIKDIEFSYIDKRNNFDMEELDEIICFKIDLLFKKHFPKFVKDKKEVTKI